MSRVVLLDAGPLGLVSNPSGSPEAKACYKWMINLRRREVLVQVPEVADYEVRRGLKLAGADAGIRRLDQIGEICGLVPVTFEVWCEAAELWAKARKIGKPATNNMRLDADMIICAQAVCLQRDGNQVEVATGNVDDFQEFVDAKKWQDINY